MKLFTFLFAVLLTSLAFGQTRLSSSTQHSFQQIEEWMKKESPHEVKVQFPTLPIYKVNGILCLSTVARCDANFSSSSLPPKLILGSKTGNIITLKIPLEEVKSNLSISGVNYLEVAPRIQKHNNKMTQDTRVDSVWQGFNLNQTYTGKDVLIGVTDWGFDYDHPMFMDTLLQNSRIRAAWDQFKIDGTPPSGFSYGVEYDTPAELDAANSDTASTYYDYGTHGNHVAGIAGGSGVGLEYRGVAFESQFLFNSLQIDVGAAIDAFNWMKNIATADGKRLVINMSWGLYYLGTMDGTSLTSQAINTLSDQGVTFVTSGGNNGGRNFHIKKNFNADTIRTRLQFFPYSAHSFMWGQSVSAWGEVSQPFSVQFEVYNSSNSLLDTSPVYTTNLNAGYHEDTIFIGSDTILYNFTVDEAHPQNNRPHIRARVKNTNTTYRIVLRSFANAGTVHYWNLVELSNGAGNWGQDFYSFGTHGVAGDNQYGIGEPACTERAITVGAHKAAFVSPSSGTEFPGNRASFSSYGPTYDERIKPDVSAPGIGVVSSISSYTTDSYTSVAQTTFNGRTYHFAAFSGTSMSSPATAGIVALMLEASPTLSSDQIREILKATARQDSKTGVIPSTGSVDWGWGKVTATAAIALAENTTSLNENNYEIELTIYPNPAEAEINIVSAQAVLNDVTYEIHSLDGKKINSGELMGTINVSNFESGAYLIRFSQNGKSFGKSLKFIKW